MQSKRASDNGLTPRQKDILHKIFILAGKRYGQYQEKDKPLIMLFAKVIGVSDSYDEAHRTKPMADALAGTLMYFSIPVTKPIDRRVLIWRQLVRMSESSNCYERKLAKALMAKIKIVKRLLLKIKNGNRTMKLATSPYNPANMYSPAGNLGAFIVGYYASSSAQITMEKDFPWALTKQQIADYINDDETILTIIGYLGEANLTTGVAGFIGYFWDFIKKRKFAPLAVAVILISGVAWLTQNRTQKSLNDLRKEEKKRHDD